MSNRVIINAKIVTPENIINNGVIVIENGRIARFGSYENVKPPDNAEIIDVKG